MWEDFDWSGIGDSMDPSFTGSLFDEIDWSKISMPDTMDPSFTGIDWGALATGGDSSTFGQNDRGLGVSGGGTLSADQIAQLGGGGASGLGLAQFLKSVGLGNKSGEFDWGNFLSLIAPLAAGAYQVNRTDKATDQQLASIDRAQAGLGAVGTENKGLYAPYRAAGDVGLQRLLQAPQSNLSGMARPLAQDYRPLGSGRGLSLSNIMRGS